MSAGKWIHSGVTDTNGIILYSFSVKKGETYYIWTNDDYDGDGSKSVDIIFSIFDDKHVYGHGDDHWTRPYVFTALDSGKVTIAVTSYYTDTGTFGIAYSTASNRP